MHFLRSSSVCVLRYIFQMRSFQTTVYRYKRYYLISYENIDISYKLDIPPSPNLKAVIIKLSHESSKKKKNDSWTDGLSSRSCK